MLRQRVKDFLAELPFGLETALLFREAVMPLPASLRPGRAFLSWARELQRIESKEDDLSPRRVLFFSSKPEWMGISLAMAVVLAARKCHVDFVFLPYTRSDREDSSSESKYFRVLLGRFLEHSHLQRLRLIDLMAVPGAPLPEALGSQAQEQGLLDTKYVLKREEIDPENNLLHQEILRFRVKRNTESMERLRFLLEENRYDVLATPNGGMMEWGAAFRLAKHLQIPAVSFEFGDHLGSIWISKGSPCSSVDTTRAWEEDAPHALLPEARQRVSRIASGRQGIRWEEFIWAPQKFSSQHDAGKLRAQLGIPLDQRPLVLMTTNIPWDSAMLGHDAAFPSLAEWVRQTLSHFFPRSDCRLLIRIHPGERLLGTGQPVEEILREVAHPLPSHIRIVGPEDPVNTYDLMGLAHFGIVYTSITGLEMAMRGIPVVVAARPHYSGKGFTHDAQTQEDYFASIDRFLKREERPRLSPREQELAWCYANVFYFSWAKPFPWHRSTFWQDIERWPMRQLLSQEGMQQFGRSFDLLADRAPSSVERAMTSEVAG